jgi:hypothetical protein
MMKAARELFERREGARNGRLARMPDDSQRLSNPAKFRTA